MVRKKASSAKRASIFAPPGKVMMLEKNRTSTPLKTPVALKSPGLDYSKSSQNKSGHSKTLKTSKKRKVNQIFRALREIRKYQGNFRLLIPKAPFSRVVKEITQNILGKSHMRFTALSLMALQEATEMAIVNLLEIANLCCTHAKRVTLAPSDLRLTRRAFGVANALNG